MNKRSFSLYLILILFFYDIKAQNEISGIFSLNNTLYLVDDEHPGTYFTYKISKDDYKRGFISINAELAFDIEDIGMIQDGSRGLEALDIK